MSTFNRQKGISTRYKERLRKNFEFELYPDMLYREWAPKLEFPIAVNPFMREFIEILLKFREFIKIYELLIMGGGGVMRMRLKVKLSRCDLKRQFIEDVNEWCRRCGITGDVVVE